MPKSTTIHKKGKSTSIQKIHKQEKSDTITADAEDSARQFQLELCWCIQQLERSINDKNSNEKQLQEAWKVLTVLKNNNQPIIRKRQLMRTHFGDYRAKMAAEEKKLVKMASKIKISEAPDKPKATFLRKSVFQTTGDSSFRFNFELNPDLSDLQTTTDSNNTNKNGNKVKIGDAELKESDPSSKAFKFSFTDFPFKFNFNVDS